MPMDQTPIEQVIHQTSGGIAGVKIPQNGSPPWRQARMDPALEANDDAVIEIINQSDRIDQVLGFNIQMLTTDAEVQQIAALQPHAGLKTLNDQSLAHMIQRLLIHIHKRELHLRGKLWILQKNVEHFRGRSTGQARHTQRPLISEP